MTYEKGDVVGTLFEQAQRGVLAPQVMTVGGVEVLLTPSIASDGKQTVLVQSIKPFLAEYRTAPERRTGQAVFEDTTSLIDHVNRFKDEHSAIFACSGMDERKEGTRTPNPRLLAVLDYHESGSTGAPRFGKHISRYNFPLSEAWKAWIANDGVEMSQAGFADWVNDRLLDVQAPERSGATAGLVAETLGITYATHQQLLQLARGLSVTIEHKVTEIRNQQTGEATLHFSEEHKDPDGQRLKIPGGFVVGLPVFRNGDLWQVPAQLRYRKRAGGLVWFYQLYNPEAAFELAFRGACDTVRAATSLPIFYGSPE